MSKDARPPWLDEALAGIYVLRNVDQLAADGIVRALLASYRGGDFGGLDLMAPNDTREAFLLLGKWTDCFEEAVQGSARSVLDGLERAASLWNAGVDMLGGGGVVVTTAPRATATIVPWYAYHARIVLPPMSASDEARAVHETFPRLPGWLGMHMGAPHWLGRGMSRDGARIVSVTPYIRADITREVLPGQSGIEIAGMAARPDFAAWLTALRSATRWF